MKRYGVAGISNLQAAPATIIGITGASTVRPVLYDLIIGNATAVAAQALVVGVFLYTAAGTSTAVTPALLMANDVVAQCTAGQTHTVEPTYTGAAILSIPLNAQASFRFVCAPYGEIVGAATTANGIGVKVTSSTATLQENATANFWE
jgi:hypothetical protein